MCVHEEATYSGWQGEAGPTGAWLNPALVPDTMAIQGNEQPRCCNKDKTYRGALCSMGSWFSLLRCQADASRSTHLGYPVGTFPAGGKYVHALPAKHPPEDQIIHLELPASYEPLVVAPERLSVACIFNSSLPSLLVDQVDILTSELVLHGFVICLDTQRVHGDFWGKDGLGPIHHEEMRLSRGSTDEVRLPHSAYGSSSIHFLPYFFK
jgi:hypothetical protein